MKRHACREHIDLPICIFCTALSVKKKTPCKYSIQVCFEAKMPEFVINGIPITFPFEPYDVQRRYMEKIIECLDKSANSVLESPTGL